MSTQMWMSEEYREDRLGIGREVLKVDWRVFQFREAPRPWSKFSTSQSPQHSWRHKKWKKRVMVFISLLNPNSVSPSLNIVWNWNFCHRRSRCIPGIWNGIISCRRALQFVNGAHHAGQSAQREFSKPLSIQMYSYCKINTPASKEATFVTLFSLSLLRWKVRF